MEKDDKEFEVKNEEYQDPQGVLDNQAPSPLETVSETFEDIDIGIIQHFTAIPDYKQPTDSRYPIVIKTPLGHFCIDGWNLLEEAKADGNTTIRCAVDELADHCEEELSIRKACLRTRPRGGIGSYAETVRNTKCLEQILLASNRDLRIFRHGGARRGEAFTNNRQENVRHVIALRLGKSVSTVNQYLNHASFLSDETLNFLTEIGAGKEFFEEAQKNKRLEIMRMRNDRMSDVDITHQISNKVPEWHEEFRESGKIKPLWTAEEIEPQETPPRETQGKGTRQTVEEAFHPWEGNPSRDEDDSLEEIKKDVEDIAKRLLEATGLTDLDQFCRRIMEEASQFYKVSLRAAAFRKHTDSDCFLQKEVLR